MGEETLKKVSAPWLEMEKKVSAPCLKANKNSVRPMAFCTCPMLPINIARSLTGNQNVLILKFNIFWSPAKMEGITDERGTSVNYHY